MSEKNTIPTPENLEPYIQDDKHGQLEFNLKNKPDEIGKSVVVAAMTQAELQNKKKKEEIENEFEQRKLYSYISWEDFCKEKGYEE